MFCVHGFMIAPFNIIVKTRFRRPIKQDYPSCTFHSYICGKIRTKRSVVMTTAYLIIGYAFI
jgi:hypothetical protein